MQGDINKFASKIIYELNLRVDDNPIDDDDRGYNLGLRTAITEIKKAINNWEE